MELSCIPTEWAFVIIAYVDVDLYEALPVWSSIEHVQKDLE